MIRSMTQRLFHLLLLAFVGLGVSVAQAQTPAEFFKGKTITLYIGFGPGGGYDGYGQLLAQHMSKHIPGQPHMIVKHMPGGGSLVLMNYLANVAPRDGTAFGIPASAAAYAPLIGTDEEKGAARFEAAKLTWIGSLEQFTPIAIAWHTSGFKTLEDAKQREMRFGSSGASSGGEVYAKLVNEFVGTKFKPVRGYRGSNEITLAMERGEIDGFVGWCWTCMKAERPQYIKDKLINLFMQIGLDPDPEMTAAGVPALLDLVKNPRDHQAAKLLLSQLALSRPFVAPPGVPADRVKALRDAFDATAADPAFLEAAAKQNRVISVMNGARIDELLKESYSLPPDIIRRATEIAAPTK